MEIPAEIRFKKKEPLNLKLKIESIIRGVAKKSD